MHTADAGAVRAQHHRCDLAARAARTCASASRLPRRGSALLRRRLTRRPRRHDRRRRIAGAVSCYVCVDGCAAAAHRHALRRRWPMIIRPNAGAARRRSDCGRSIGRRSPGLLEQARNYLPGHGGGAGDGARVTELVENSGSPRARAPSAHIRPRLMIFGDWDLAPKLLPALGQPRSTTVAAQRYAPLGVARRTDERRCVPRPRRRRDPPLLRGLPIRTCSTPS